MFIRYLCLFSVFCGTASMEQFRIKYEFNFLFEILSTIDGIFYEPVRKKT
jgi:hypothetical protein